MARTSRKSVYEKIEDTLNQIKITEDTLNSLNKTLTNLYQEKEDYEMRQAWNTLKQNNISISDLEKLLSNKLKK